MSIFLDIMAILVNTVATWLISNGMDWQSFVFGEKRIVLVAIAAVGVASFGIAHLAKMIRDDYPRVCGAWEYTARTEKGISHGGTCEITRQGEKISISGIRRFECNDDGKKEATFVGWKGEGIRSGKTVYYNYYHANGATAGACFLEIDKNKNLVGELRLSMPHNGPEGAFSYPKKDLHRYLVMERPRGRKKASN